MTFFIAFILFIALGTVLFAFGAAWLAPSSTLATRLHQLSGFTHGPSHSRTWQQRVEKTLTTAGKVAPKSASELSKTELFLTRAGFRDGRHVAMYFGVRVLCAAAAFGLLVVSSWGLRRPVLLVMVPLLAYLLPKLALFRMIRRRQNNIRLSLPDALDLLVICVEAGLGLDQAVTRVSQEVAFAHPALSEELQLVTLETKAGRPRPDALRNLALRTGVDDIRALVAVLVQTDRFGTSIAQALRVHSDSLRTERRQRAEEAAAKTTIKMVPVLVLCLFPAMFIVSIGPAAIALLREVRPMLLGQ
jgi:tight adherence protein C